MFALDSNAFEIADIAGFKGEIYEVKGSKFITHLFTLDSINLDSKRKIIIESLRENHKKAVHFVESFRILNEFNQVVEGFSDDGEPRGSGGEPCLQVLRGEDLINIFCVCVRYFGGVKLGVGGLVRAYSGSVLDSIKMARNLGYLKLYEKLVTKIIESKSANFNKIAHIANKLNIKILNKKFSGENISLTLSGTKEKLEKFMESYEK